MTTSEPVHDADTQATIIPFRPRSTMAPHPSVGPPEPVPSATADDLCSRPHPTPLQLSFFETQSHPINRASL
jgi:hypothetical protein